MSLNTQVYVYWVCSKVASLSAFIKILHPNDTWQSNTDPACWVSAIRRAALETRGMSRFLSLLFWIYSKAHVQVTDSIDSSRKLTLPYRLICWAYMLCQKSGGRSPLCVCNAAFFITSPVTAVHHPLTHPQSGLACVKVVILATYRLPGPVVRLIGCYILHGLL